MLMFSVYGYAASQDYEKCIETGNVASAECSGDEYDRQDKRLNAAYKAVIKSKPELKTEQRSWIKSRDESCVEPNENIETAHLWDMHYLCLSKITEKRAIELENILTTATTATLSENKTLEPDLKPVNKKPENFKDAMEFYRATDGGYLAGSPKIRADGVLYGIVGKICLANEDNSILATYGNCGEKQFDVKIPEELKEKYLSTAQINGYFYLVGRYIENKQYISQLRSTIEVPSFEAVYFEMIK